jgi:hypothetical protein
MIAFAPGRLPCVCLVFVLSPSAPPGLRAPHSLAVNFFLPNSNPKTDHNVTLSVPFCAIVGSRAGDSLSQRASASVRERAGVRAAPAVPLQPMKRDYRIPLQLQESPSCSCTIFNICSISHLGIARITGKCHQQAHPTRTARTPSPPFVPIPKILIPERFSFLSFLSFLIYHRMFLSTINDELFFPHRPK